MGRLYRPEDDLRQLSALDPHRQAEMLAEMAQHARLIHLAFADESIAAPELAEDFERALGQALDAEAPHESLAAKSELKRVLHAIREFGLRVSASITETSIDGVLGAVRLPVLTAHFAPA